jgi:hypothetical protein
MIEQDWAILLARIQFAFTVSFHFLFPAFSIGLASFLAVLEGLWLKTGKGVYANLYRYWLKIFAVVFAMGVVSGTLGMPNQARRAGAAFPRSQRCAESRLARTLPRRRPNGSSSSISARSSGKSRMIRFAARLRKVPIGSMISSPRFQRRAVPVLPARGRRPLGKSRAKATFLIRRISC